MKALLVSVTRLFGTFALLAAFLPLSGLPGQASALEDASSSIAPNRAQVEEGLQNSPLMFIENAGQLNAGARFVVQGSNSSVFLADDAIWLSLAEKPKGDEGQGSGVKEQGVAPEDRSALQDQPRKGVNLKVSFAGANSKPRIEPFNRLETQVSYFIGNDASKWHSDVPVWGGVRYVDLYPGIDLEVSGESGRLTQRLVANGRANLDAVKMRVEGPDSLTLNGDNLNLQTAIGNYSLPLLEVVNNGKPFDSNLATGAMVSGDTVSRPFSSSAEPMNPDLVPPADQLVYSTFLGGSNWDAVRGIAIDASGAAYVAGCTYSSGFPTTAGAYDGSLGGVFDAFVAKLNSSGTGLAYSTFLGGSNSDEAAGVAVEAGGIAYVAGPTFSNDFPTTVGAYDNTLGGSRDVFVAKLNSSGTGLVYSTYLGGGSIDSGGAIAIDSSGAAYVAGFTESNNFPTVGAYDNTLGGSRDVFVTKLNSSGANLTYSTFLGGSAIDGCSAIAVDSTGAAFVAGYTYSPDFPTTSGAYDGTLGGSEDAFLTKLNTNGSGLTYSTFLGGNLEDWPGGIAVDGSGAAYVAGYTYSSDFPTTSGAYDRTYGGGGFEDAFVSKLNSNGTGLAYSTYLGGGSDDAAFAIAVDSFGAAYVAGFTYSNNFPTTVGAYDRTWGGVRDVFVTKLRANGTGLLYSTYLGGSDIDIAEAVAIDASGAAYVAGHTYSSTFPTTAGAYDRTYGDGGDAFVTKFAVNSLLYLPVVLDNAYGGWTTGIGIRNPATTTNNVGIVYYDNTGQVAGTDWKSVPPNGSWGIYNGGKFGGDWAGSATIFGDYPVTAVVNEVGPGNYSMGYTGAITATKTIYLPAVMDNAYGGWTSGIGIKNTSNIVAAATIRYYHPNGAPAGSESQTIQPNGYWGVYQGGKFGAGWAGSAVVTSGQPIVAVVNEVHSSGSAISYNGFPAGGNLVNLPAALNNAYGGWTTGVSIQNTSANSASGTITYYNANGTPAGQQSINLAGKGSTGLYQGTAGLPDGWAGSAVVSTTTAVVAIVNEVPTSGDAMGYGGVVTGETEVNLPAVMDNAYGGWNTGMGIQNTSGSAVHVDITFYGGAGTNIGSAHQTIPGHGYLGLYQGGALGEGAGSARIISNQPLAAIVNEIGPGGAAISYNGTQ